MLCRPSGDLRVNCSKGVTCLGSLLPVYESHGISVSNQGPCRCQAHSLYFFILVFSPSLPEQRLRAEGSTEENSAEFLSSMPSLSLSLWWRLHFAHHYSCMSKGKGRSRLSPGRQPGDQMAIQGTKDCESTLDVEGTSQTRTFKGLPSLNSMLTEKSVIV